MADTASQNAPPRKTLQQEIDFQTSVSGGRMVTFMVKGKTGDAVVPPFVSIRFIDCNIQALTVDNDSIICFDKCILESDSGVFKVANSAVLATNTTKFKSPIKFSNCSVEIKECEIGQTITLTDTSFLKSISNDWKSTSSKTKIGVVADKGSRVESYRDIWEKWDDYFWKATSNSIIKIINPAKLDQSAASGNGRGFGITDSSSVLVLSHPKEISISNNTTPVFTGTNNSRFELYNLPSLISDSILFKLTTSKAIVRNIKTLKSNKDKLADLTGSTIDFSNVSEFGSNSDETFDLFSLNSSTVTFSNATSLKAKGIIFNLNQSNINFVSNSFDFNSDSAEGAILISSNNIAIKANNSKIFAKYIKTLSSGTTSALDLTNSSFKGNNFNSIKGGTDGTTINAVFSYLNISNTKNITGFGSNSIYLKGTKASLTNIDTIKNGSGSGAGLRIIDASSAVCKNVRVISGPDDGVFLENNSSLIFKNKAAQITGTNTSGLSVGTGCRVVVSETDTISSSNGSGVNNIGTKARIELKDVKNITGSSNGLNITGADLIFDNSGLDSSTVSGSVGVRLSSSNPLGTYKATIVGPISVSGGTALNAINYQITEQGIAWNGDVITTNCLVNNTLSKTAGKILSSNSHTNSLRASADKDLTLTNSSSFNAINSSIAGNATLSNSYINFILSTIQNIALDGSFFGGFTSKIGSLTLSGLSSALGGASHGATVTPSVDPSFSNPVAYFVASSGDLALQADSNVKIESNIIKETARNQIISTVASSSINITATAIAGNSPVITWN